MERSCTRERAAADVETAETGGAAQGRSGFAEAVKTSVVSASGGQDRKARNPSQYLIAQTGSPSAEGSDTKAAFVADYLTVTAEDGAPLLTAYDAITVSCWVKILKTAAGNWSFYAAADNRIVQNNHEQYAAVMDKGDNIEIQRFKNEGKRPKSVTAGSLAADEGRFVATVFSEDKTTLYVNGEKKAEEAAAAWQEAKQSADCRAAEDVSAKIRAIGTVDLTEGSRARIEEARAAYNSLTEGQKKLVSRLTVLAEAEAEYSI